MCVYRWRRDQKAASLLVANLQRDGDSVVVAKGAQGGLGNSAQMSPHVGNSSAGVWAQVGGHPEQACILLDSRLQADVALVGLPNAGKSSLLRAVTAAKPKVAPYAFTTTQPQLGALAGSVAGHWVSIADLPGLLQGAHQDRGLGLDFLKYAHFCSLANSLNGNVTKLINCVHHIFRLWRCLHATMTLLLL